MRVGQYQNNSKACLYFCDQKNFNGVMLTGTAEVLEDAAHKEMLWQEGDTIYYPGGRSELVGAVEALERIKAVLKQFREKKHPILFIKHSNTSPSATFFLPDTFGVEIHSDITPLADEPVVVKHAPNSFSQTNLLELFQNKGVGELVVCGMMTHMCIDTTVCATKDLHFMGNRIPAGVVQDTYMAGLNGMFAEIRRTEEFEL